MSDPVGTAVLIRLAEMSDAGALAVLMTQLGYETSAGEMEKRLGLILSDARYRTLVAVVKGRVCGMIGTLSHPSYEHNDLSARILALVVEEQMRGRGVGRLLVEAAEEGLAREKITRLSVNTRLTRREAHLFYERLRYEKNGFRYVKSLAAPADSA